jgi:hypothetical protein
LLNVRRLGFVLLCLAIAGSLAACGSGKKSTTSSGPSAQAQIKSAYVKFFSSKTSVSDKVALLQNGPKFKTVIEGFASNPLASNVSATVSSVTLQGANKAKVVYAVKVSGSALGQQTGSAVLENGVWKVGDASLCKLISLGGTTPPVCKTS